MEDFNLNLKRFSDNGESTLGLMYAQNKFECYSLEDQYQKIKVKGQTRIPEGLYQIKFREYLTGMTERYRKKYTSFFTFHLELQNVPGFKYIYIHSGNTDDHTEGCILVANTVNNNMISDGFAGHSAPAFEKLYKNISQQINTGRKVFIKIEDISKAQNIAA